MRRVREHCHKIVCDTRNGILPTRMRVRGWMGEAIVEADLWEVPRARVGIGAHRCDLVLLAILRAKTDGWHERLHSARAGLARRDAVGTSSAEAEVPAATSLRIIIAGYKHR